ncbi:MAG: hypothetical protein JWM25_1781 [Thermoleophilia bacterium]|nr:hypothetical protein [Thermoleophilia bacterium]MCZ4497196.1 hypothetical protein [Thermoleophilia bacterium]
MFHATLFALLGAMFCLFAFAAGRADLLVIAIPAGLMALWMVDSAVRSARGALKRRRSNSTTTDGRR